MAKRNAHYFGFFVFSVVCFSNADLLLAAEDIKSETSNKLTLSTNALVERVVKKNAQVKFSELQKEIANEKVEFESGVYQTELFSNLKYDDAHIQRSAGDKATSPSKNILNESNTNLSLGVRQLLSTGGELTVSYSALEKNNNIIPSYLDTAERDSEFTTALNFQITQPLLKGWDNIAVDSRINRAMLEVDVADAQHRQQLLKLISQSLSSYWQLYKAKEFLKIRNLAVINAEKMVESIKQRVINGKEPESALVDAKSELLKRRVSRASAQQALNEVAYQVSTLMSDNDDIPMDYNLVSTPSQAPFQLDEDFDSYYQKVLDIWPNANILKRSISIQNEEIKVAKNSHLPQLDLELGYTSNDISESFEAGNAFEGEYPSWYIGLNFSMPLGENRRAKAQLAMANLKKRQHKEDLRAVRIGLKNDLKSRIFQVKMAHQEIQVLNENIEILSDIYESELEKFRVGYGDLKSIYLREDALNLERQRLIDGLVKYELSKVSLSLADGSLLGLYINDY